MDYGLLWDSWYAIDTAIVAHAIRRSAYIDPLARSTIGLRSGCRTERNTYGWVGTATLWSKTDSFRLSVCHSVWIAW